MSSPRRKEVGAQTDRTAPHEDELRGPCSTDCDEQGDVGGCC